MAEPAASKTGSRGGGLPPLLEKAFAAHQAGDLDTAETHYRAFLESSPDNPTALQLYGVLLSKKKDYPSAIQLMQKSLQLFPEQPEVANNLGNALKRYGRPDDAIGCYARAIELYPGYVEAHRNKALCHLANSQFDDAEKCIRRALEIHEEDAVSWLVLGNVHRRKGDFKAAVPCYERALELKPAYAEAHHNLGLCRRMLHEPARAIEHYEKARSLGLGRAELYLNLGNALIDDLETDRAIDAYREAVSRNPADLESHKNLNSLLYQQNRLDEYLASYREALEANPSAEPLRLDYAISLYQTGDYEKSIQVLQAGLERARRPAELGSLLGLALERLGEWDRALDAHARAVQAGGKTSEQHINYARALLARQRPDEALEQARLGTVDMPFNQRALAYLGLCWRLLGDRRDSMLNDYENMVRVYDVPVPAGYRDAAEFNADLARTLDALHIGKRHPPEQTLRGGSQTYGDLFVRKEPAIVELVRSIKRCVEDYIGRMPYNAEHPLLARRTARYDFRASWSVRLASCGYHEMHVHPLGWISSAYYVQVPPEVSRDDDEQGGIKFGEPDIDIGDEGRARRLIKPATGRLVLFPSYMWHGTIPFESPDSRMTVAFDVVPVGRPLHMSAETRGS